MTGRVAHLNYHAPLGRLGGAAGMALQQAAWAKVKERVAYYADHRGVYTFLTTDDNDHGANKPHPRARLLHRDGIDKIWMIPPRKKADREALKIEVLRKKVVDLNIDGHNAPGVYLRIQSAGRRRPLVFWLVQANLGRGESVWVFKENARDLRAGFPGKLVLGLDEIDEADWPDEHEGLRQIFPAPDYDLSGFGSLVPTVVQGLVIIRSVLTHACGGMKRVSPPRVITETTLEV